MKFRIRVNISGENVEVYKTARNENMALVYTYRQMMKLYGLSYADVANRYFEIKEIRGVNHGNIY